MFEPIKAPWIRPGVVIHDPQTDLAGMLSAFAMELRQRGFRVAGVVETHDGDGRPMLLDIADGTRLRPHGEAEGLALAARSLRKAMRDDADLSIISRFSAFQGAAREMLATIDDGLSQGMPLLTGISGSDLRHWLDFAQGRGTMIAPDMCSLWQWWGPERLYGDLALGVADDDVRQIVCGPRWLMVQGPHGVGLSYLPRSGKDLLPRLQTLQRQSLRQLADLSRSWDPLEMALGMAAINAHYNRPGIEHQMGNGAEVFGSETGRVVVIGAFPGLADALDHPQVIETDPRPGEYPTIAMDSLLPGCAAAVVASSSIINRTLPRILRLAHGAKAALVGPCTPLTPRLYDYGLTVLGGLLIHDAAGLAAAIRQGALPREFVRFGSYVHIRQQAVGNNGRNAYIG